METADSYDLRDGAEALNAAGAIAIVTGTGVSVPHRSSALTVSAAWLRGCDVRKCYPAARDDEDPAAGGGTSPSFEGPSIPEF